ncbi:cell division protein DivIVA [bacterium BMS3Bbin02]|nr:cell division protein DivIVA [bacterium BMS3Bbin02]
MVGEPLKGANVSEITAESMGGQSFELVRRGFDPEAVTDFLDQASKRFRVLEARIEELQASTGRLADIQAKENALRTAVLAAGKAKDGVLAAANEQAGRVVADARRSAFKMLNETRAGADELLAETTAERDALERDVNHLKSIVQQTVSLLKGMAAGALGDLAQADRLLESANEIPAPDDAIAVDITEVAEEPTPHPVTDLVEQMTTMMDGSGDAAALPDAVDKLLAQLRSGG